MSIRALQAGRRRLRLEALERKCMLSGNVLLSLNAAGDLVLTGDNAANGVSIREDATNIIVSGITTSAPTTIQGFPSLSVPKSSVTHDFKINLNNGDDVLQIGVGSAAQVEVKHDLIANMGLFGNKVLVMEGVKVDHSATLSSGFGQDLFDIRQLPGGFSSAIVGDLRLTTANNNKMIVIGNTTVGGSAWINAGFGDHLIGVAGNSIGGSFNVFTLGGNDTFLSTLNTTTTDGAISNFAAAHPYFNGTNPPFGANATTLKNDLNAAATAAFNAVGNSLKVAGDAEIQTSIFGGNDFIDIATASIGGDLQVEPGNGLNVIGISGGSTLAGPAITTIGADLSITTGLSDDLVTLLAVNVVNNLNVRTGWGNDIVGASSAHRTTAFVDYNVAHPFTPTSNTGLLKSEFGADLGVPNITANNIDIRLGWGNDILIFDWNTFNSAFLDGGPGSNDTLDKSGNNNTGSLTFVNFETVL